MIYKFRLITCSGYGKTNTEKLRHDLPVIAISLAKFV
jgi:hypothetical protein